MTAAAAPNISIDWDLVATEPTAPSAARAEAVKELRAFLRGSRLVMLTTRDAQGLLHTRPMEVPAAEFDGDLWFVTPMDAPIASQLRACPTVLVTCVDRDTDRCMVLNGTARIQRDPRRARSLWRPEFSAWFPRGPMDPSVGLIHVEVLSADVWE